MKGAVASMLRERIKYCITNTRRYRTQVKGGKKSGTHMGGRLFTSASLTTNYFSFQSY